jgi:hypothetical protein
MECLDGHSYTWRSSDTYSKQDPRGRARSVLNVHLAAHVLLEGLHFAPTKVVPNP